MTDWYLLLVILHVSAALIWFGHMFFWSLVAGFATKTIEPPEKRQLIRDIGTRWGGFGWPSLFVLIVTGVAMIAANGITVHHVVSGEFMTEPIGRVMALKITIVAGMVGYQWFVGHKPAPRLIYVNMMAAALVIGLSVLRVRSPW